MRDLDSARLEHALAGLPAAEVAYQHGVTNIVGAVTSGAATAGVLLRPVSITEIRRTADEGLLMPPKSTFFTPKLRTGLVLRPLDPESAADRNGPAAAAAGPTGSCCVRAGPTPL